MVPQVRPGGKGPLSRRERQIIDDIVEDAKPEVRHSDFVGIGKREGDTNVKRALFFPCVEFTVYIAARFLEAGKVHPYKITSGKDLEQGKVVL